MARNLPGELIAVDGACGRELERAAEKLCWRTPDNRYAGAISRWNASGAFSTLPAGNPPGPRAVLLVYAADLAWRLREQIQPAVGRGQRIVAAPYVSTAIALGLACGLGQSWLEQLFRFAPPPEGFYAAPGTQSCTADPAEGFVEYCSTVLSRSGPAWSSAAFILEVSSQLEPAAECCARMAGSCRTFLRARQRLYSASQIAGA